MHATLSHGPHAEINVTPLIDVMLVLIIVSMLCLRVLQFLRVAVPSPHPSAARPDRETIVLELRADHSCAINGRPVSRNLLGPRLAGIYRGRVHRVLYVKASPSWKYGEVIEAVDLARSAGAELIAYVPPKGP